CTHLPQLVQLEDCAQGRFMSQIIMLRMPRELTSHTCAPSTSAHTRTQRVHRMHRLWSSTKRGCDTSAVSFGYAYGERTLVTPNLCAIACSSQWLLETQTA